MTFNRQSINIQIRANAEINDDALKRLSALTAALDQLRVSSDQLKKNTESLLLAAQELSVKGFSQETIAQLRQAVNEYKSQEKVVRDLAKAVETLRAARQREVEAAEASARATRNATAAGAGGVGRVGGGIPLSGSPAPTPPPIPPTGDGLRRSVPTFLQFSLFPFAGIASRAGAPGIANAALAAGDFIGIADAIGIVEAQIPKLNDNLRRTGGIFGQLARAGTQVGNRINPLVGNLLGIAAAAAPVALAVGGVSLVLTELQRRAEEFATTVRIGNEALRLSFGNPAAARQRLLEIESQLQIEERIAEVRRQQFEEAGGAFQPRVSGNIFFDLAANISELLRRQFQGIEVDGDIVSLNELEHAVNSLGSANREAQTEINNLRLGLRLAEEQTQRLNLGLVEKFLGDTVEGIVARSEQFSTELRNLDILQSTGLFDSNVIKGRVLEIQQELRAAIAAINTGIPAQNSAEVARRAAEEFAERVRTAYLGGFTSGFELTSDDIRGRIADEQRRIAALRESIAFGADEAAVNDQIRVAEASIDGLTQALSSNAVAANDARAAQERLNQRLDELARIGGKTTIQTLTQTTGRTIEDLRQAQEELDAYNRLLAQQPQLTALFASEIEELQTRISALQAGIPTNLGQALANPANRRAIEEYRNEIEALTQSFIENQQRAAEERAITDARDLEDFTIARRRAFEDYNRELQRAQEDQLRQRAREERANTKRLRDFEDRLRRILEQLNADLRRAAGNRDAVAFTQAQENAAQQIRDLRRNQNEQEQARREQLQEEEEARELSRKRREEDFRLRLRREDEDRALRQRRLVEDLTRRNAIEQQAYQAQLNALVRRFNQETNILALIEASYRTAFDNLTTSANTFVNNLRAVAAGLTVPPNPYVTSPGPITLTPGIGGGLPNPYTTNPGSIIGRTPVAPTPIRTAGAPVINFQVLGTGLAGVIRAVNQQLDSILRSQGF
jgi:hypothetical protein